jgi:hypothetical protein
MMASLILASNRLSHQGLENTAISNDTETIRNLECHARMYLRSGIHSVLLTIRIIVRLSCPNVLIGHPHAVKKLDSR